MCLGTVSEVKPPKSGFGWKVFKNKNDGFHGCYFVKSKPYIVGEWNTAEAFLNFKTIYARADVSYPIGFHIYTREKDAKAVAMETDLTVARVQYSGGHTLGWELGGEVVVATRMRIIGR